MEIAGTHSVAPCVSEDVRKRNAYDKKHYQNAGGTPIKPSDVNSPIAIHTTIRCHRERNIGPHDIDVHFNFVPAVYICFRMCEFISMTDLKYFHKFK